MSELTFPEDLPSEIADNILRQVSPTVLSKWLYEKPSRRSLMAPETLYNVASKPTIHYFVEGIYQGILERLKASG
jgi:hypothetical protein